MLICKLFGHIIFRTDYGRKKGTVEHCDRISCDYERRLGTYFTPEGGNQPVPKKQEQDDA